MEPIDYVSISISADEGDFVWTCDLTLKDINDYGKFHLDDAFEVTVGADTYSFIVDSIELERNAPANVGPRIVGVSPGARFDFPRADPYTKEWSTDVLAKDAAEDALGGETIQWDILNWTLPAYRLSVSEASPISVVQQIAEAAGAVVESNLDGSLRVRYRHEVSVPDYPTTSPAHVMTERDDILTVNERGAPDLLINRVRISDIDAAYTDFMEFEQDTSDPSVLQGTLKAFPGPWRDIALVNVYNTRAPGEVIQTFTNTVTETVLDANGNGELIEIYGGKGSTRKPIWGLVELVWESQNIGSVVWTPGSSTLAVGDENSYGLFWLKYQTKYHAYHVTFTGSVDVSQFIMEDLTGD